MGLAHAGRRQGARGKGPGRFMEVRVVLRRMLLPDGAEREVGRDRLEPHRHGDVLRGPGRGGSMRGQVQGGRPPAWTSSPRWQRCPQIGTVALHSTIQEVRGASTGRRAYDESDGDPSVKPESGGVGEGRRASFRAGERTSRCHRLRRVAETPAAVGMIDCSDGVDG